MKQTISKFIIKNIKLDSKGYFVREITKQKNQLYFFFNPILIIFLISQLMEVYSKCYFILLFFLSVILQCSS